MAQILKFAALTAALSVGAALSAAPGIAAVPTHTALEGVLMSSGGGPAADGNYTVTIGIYSAETGGNPIWAESGVTVAAKGGQFSFQLGAKTPLAATALNLTSAWIGIQIGSDPELPRKPLGSAPFALRAAIAEGLECSGCLKAGNLDAGVLQPYAKSADLGAYAKTADLGAYAKTSDLAAYAKTADLSGYAKAADLADYVKASSLAKVAGTGSFNDLKDLPTLHKVATTGSYADLGNVPVMAKIGAACGTNLVMKGIKADGSYECASAGIAPDMINEISNDLIWNQFVDSKTGTPDVQIKDGFSAGVTDTLAFPDVGLVEKIWVDFSGLNSDMTKVVVELYGPGMSTPYVLYNGGKTGTAVVAKYNDGDALVSGDMNKDWLNKNIKGNWSITVKDIAAIQVPPGTPPFTYDGKFNWGINIQTLSSKKIQIKGNLIVDGDLTVKGVNSTQTNGNMPATYRMAMFDTHQHNVSWLMGNNASMYGGVNPSNWTDNNYLATHMSADKEVLRTVFNQKRYAGKNANVCSSVYIMYSSTTARVCMALFRVKNTSTSNITWTPHWYWTAYSGWSEQASIAVNGANTWNTSGSGNGAVNLTIPANRVSTVIFVTTSATQVDVGWNGHERATVMGFYNNSLALPPGLQFIDDLDTAAGGWEQ